jgi:hypothetical protein
VGLGVGLAIQIFVDYYNYYTSTIGDVVTTTIWFTGGNSISINTISFTLGKKIFSNGLTTNGWVIASGITLPFTGFHTNCTTRTVVNNKCNYSHKFTSTFLISWLGLTKNRHDTSRKDKKSDDGGKPKTTMDGVLAG